MPLGEKLGMQPLGQLFNSLCYEQLLHMYTSDTMYYRHTLILIKVAIVGTR